MAEYNTLYDYLKACDVAKTRLEKIEAIIAALEDSLLEGALTADISEYWLDDGQTKVKSVLRNPKEIYEAIASLEKHKVMIVNRCKGNATILIPSQNKLR